MVKEKPNSTRIYDKDGFRQRAACICVRSVEENEVSEFSYILWTRGAHARSIHCMYSDELACNVYMIDMPINL